MLGKSTKKFRLLARRVGKLDVSVAQGLAFSAARFHCFNRLFPQGACYRRIMWSRALGWLACPVCNGALRSETFVERRVEITAVERALATELGLLDDDFQRNIESGVLLCSACQALYPIFHGLPILVPYATPSHDEFRTAFADPLDTYSEYDFPAKDPVRGEQFVMRSFSKEWLEYDYDGVIRDLSYEDHEKRFLAEIGPEVAEDGRGGLFVEIGCGLGLTTLFAAKNLRCDALGVDLSLAVMRATQQFKSNPFLHFVQGSAFYLPLRKSLATVMYSHGVLHHTYSTSEAVALVSRHCGKEGWLYLWLYGSGSKRGSLARRIAYGLENAMRPSIARNLGSLPSRAALGGMAYAYLLVNSLH